MASDGSAESMQGRIQVARRDAEGLKDRIKRLKDELADTTRTRTTCSLNCMRFLVRVLTLMVNNM